MSSINDNSYYRYYCLINTAEDFKKLSFFSKLVHSHDISVVSKIYDSPEECVKSCANLVKAVMTEVNETSDTTYKILWDTVDSFDLLDTTAKEVTVAKFYLVDKTHIGKSSTESLPTCFSATVVKLERNLETKFELLDKSLSEKNYLN